MRLREKLVLLGTLGPGDTSSVELWQYVGSFSPRDPLGASLRYPPVMLIVARYRPDPPFISNAASQPTAGHP